MQVTREQLIKLLNKEMTELKLKIIEHSCNADICYKDCDDEERLEWKKARNHSMRYQRRYIATEYTKAVLIVHYSKDQIFDTHTCDLKKLIADVVDFYGKEAGEAAEVTWDMTLTEIEEKY
jgi:hypothetical protein